jgi:hypothetical protein
LSAKWCWRRKTKSRRLGEISCTPFDTLKAPTVGLDTAATEWARLQFERLADKSLTVEEFLRRMNGFRVLSLVPVNDGLPRYTNGSPGGYVEAYSFRGQFLRDCEGIIGPELLESAYVSKTASETTAYGRELLNRASVRAHELGIDLTAVHSAEDPESVEFHLDVVQSAGRWCVFWGDRGHWLEAYS